VRFFLGVRGVWELWGWGGVWGGGGGRGGGGGCGSGRGGGLVVEKVGQDRVDHDEL